MLLSGLSAAGVRNYDAREMRDASTGQPDRRTPVPVPHAVRNCEPNAMPNCVKYLRDRETHPPLALDVSARHRTRRTDS